MELTDSQYEILSALVSGYQSSESPLTGEELAEVLDRHPGTIRNQMQTLKALDLVEGIPGPKGGYKPTPAAFEALDARSIDEEETLTLARETDRLDITVEEIDFIDVNDPEKCRVRVRFQSAVTELEPGDPLVVGPTPKTRLVLAGTVAERGDRDDELYVDVTRLDAPLGE